MVSSGTPRSWASGSSASICVPRIGPTTAGGGGRPTARSQAVTAASGVVAVSSTSVLKATSRIWLAASSAPLRWLVPSSATKPVSGTSTGSRISGCWADAGAAEQERERGGYCAAPPAHGDITSFMPVSSPGRGIAHDAGRVGEAQRRDRVVDLDDRQLGRDRLLHGVGQVAVDADRADARDVDARLVEGRLDVEAAVDQHQRELRHRRHDAPAARGADAEPGLAVLRRRPRGRCCRAAACPARSSWAGRARGRTTACRCSW